MKNLTKILFACLCLGMVFVSCNKDNFDWDAYYKEQAELAKKEQARRDSLLRIQAPLLEQYAETHFTNPQFSDSTDIWYEVLAPGEANSFDYKLTASNGQLYYIFPSVSINYVGELINGTKFAQSTEGTPSNYSNLSTAIAAFSSPNSSSSAWLYAFVPRVINYNGTDYKTNGLLTKGLQKGTKIRFIAPSYLGFDKTEYKGINNVTVPKDTPIIYTIEVTAIGAATSN